MASACAETRNVLNDNILFKWWVQICVKLCSHTVLTVIKNTFPHPIPVWDQGIFLPAFYRWRTYDSGRLRDSAHVELRLPWLSQLPIVLRCSTLVSKDIEAGEARPQAHWAIWLALYWACGHHGNQLGHRKGKFHLSIWACYLPWAETRLGGPLVYAQVTSSVPAHTRHPADVWMKTLRVARA